MSSLKQHFLIHSASICWVHIKCPGKGLGTDTVGSLIPPLPCPLGSIRGVLPDTQPKLTGPGGPQGPATPRVECTSLTFIHLGTVSSTTAHVCITLYILHKAFLSIYSFDPQKTL